MMSANTEYEKIQTVYKRDPDTKHKTLLHGQFSRPEFELLRNIPWEGTEKIDGTNVRLVYDGERITYHGRANRSEIPTPLARELEQLVETRTESFREAFGEKPVVVYGEGYGAGIQKGGGKYRDIPGFIAFDVKVNGVYLRRRDCEEVCRTLGFDVVPTVMAGHLEEHVQAAKNGFPSVFGDFRAEGLVVRPCEELRDRFGQRIITKIKTTDF